MSINLTTQHLTKPVSCHATVAQDLGEPHGPHHALNPAPQMVPEVVGVVHFPQCAEAEAGDHVRAVGQACLHDDLQVVPVLLEQGVQAWDIVKLLKPGCHKIS